MYCARVTERYVGERVIDFRGERRAIGNGDFHGDAAGCAGGHGDGRAGAARALSLGEEVPVTWRVTAGPRSTVTTNRNGLVFPGELRLSARPRA
ncbi:hypothetical protein GCM10017668_16360 [Streptomyces tuirus]|uniref:Uncharacterized protein n=1 Tax=Streptomyces tuirus TaxID=68278 RepID=A0A7G1N9L4_9ACTN|nr:hypothetical protein GCM10017668_16360 [Streptomyces tuirus]